LVLSTRGVALLPASIDSYLPPSIVSRCFGEEQPMIDLVLGYHRANKPPVPGRFLARIAELSAHVKNAADAGSKAVALTSSPRDRPAREDGAAPLIRAAGVGRVFRAGKTIDGTETIG
ncbi:MAG TPA: hypothetical protein VIZ17_03250, partial [Acetobacteraceae bacterium]